MSILTGRERIADERSRRHRSKHRNISLHVHIRSAGWRIWKFGKRGGGQLCAPISGNWENTHLKLELADKIVTFCQIVTTPIFTQK